MLDWVEKREGVRCLKIEFRETRRRRGMLGVWGEQLLDAEADAILGFDSNYCLRDEIYG